MKIEGAAAVVTGGASGLGEATARALAARGAKVAVFDRDADKGEKVAAEIGGIFCEVDVMSDEKVAAAFEKARAAHGQERILVNCAGVANAAKTVARDKETKAPKMYPMQQFELVVGINLIGTFRCISHSAFGMVSAGPLDDGERGVIVDLARAAALGKNAEPDAELLRKRRHFGRRQFLRSAAALAVGMDVQIGARKLGCHCQRCRENQLRKSPEHISSPPRSKACSSSTSRARRATA